MTYSVLHTARLVLRPPEAQDAEFIVKAMSDRRVWEWLSVIPNPYTHLDAMEFIETIALADNARVIVDAEGPVGVIGCSDELGYWLIPEAWGQGYMTEAGEAVVDWFFESSDSDVLKSGHFNGNARSRGTLMKLGFSDRGEKTLGCVSDGRTDIPSRHMEMTRDEWRARRTVRLETERLVLRELRDDDAPALQAALGRPEVARNLISVQAPWSDNDVARFITLSKFRGRLGFRLAILRDDQLIGVVGIGGRDVPSVSYALSPENWGQGFASEAFGAMLTYVDAQFAPPIIVADHFDDVPASGAILRRHGFVETGEDMGTSPGRKAPARLITYERRHG